jgi:hypothetical protein
MPGWHNTPMPRERDEFDNAASFIVEEHMRMHDCFVPHPDLIKNAIAQELRDTWDEAVEKCVQKARTIAIVSGTR